MLGEAGAGNVSSASGATRDAAASAPPGPAPEPPPATPAGALPRAAATEALGAAAPIAPVASPGRSPGGDAGGVSPALDGAASEAPSDEELEARWKGGSAPAFAVLFERYHRRIYAFACRLTGDTHSAEDVAQRAFLNLYRKPPPGTGRASFKALLFTVARNEALNEIKRRGRRREAPIDAAPEAASPASSPADALDGKEAAARLQDALASMPAEERELVLLRQVEGLTFREVCEVSGLSRDAVRWRLARGMEHLRRALREGGDPCP